MGVKQYDPKQEQDLMADLWSEGIKDNLVNFVRYAYPWGQKGTPLEHHKGPRAWQLNELVEMTEHIKIQKGKLSLGLAPTMWKKATASGRGPGKSALVAWLVHWMMSTRLGSTTIVTANTEPQLKTRTFAELSKWITMSINAHWFDVTVLSVKPKDWFKEALVNQLKIDTGYYFAQAQLWSEENPDAFAGVHNPLGVMVIYDEASGIPNGIFTVTEGFFTEPVLDRYWNIYSNPRRNSGGFYECFHSHKAFWRLRHIDSRSVEGVDFKIFDELITKHGIDSDVVRIEVLGQFPKQGNRQFISSELVRAAQTRAIEVDAFAPIIMGVDVARFGDDSSVIRLRQGRDARSFPVTRFKNRDNMYVANEVAKLIDRFHPDAVFIDAGNGTGVIDRLRELKYKPREVWFGGKANSKEWANKRTEMYADTRDWLGGAAIDDSAALFTDLTAAEYDFFGKAKDSVNLESKESMKSRGLNSPDEGDALALTFAERVARRSRSQHDPRSLTRIAEGVDFPVI